MKKIAAGYRVCFSDKRFLLSLGLALFMFAAALVINVYAVGYATTSASNPVTDIVLSNIGPYDVDGIFVNGAMLMVLVIILVCLSDPKRIPLTVKAISVFIVVRSIFIICTHIGAFPTHTLIHPDSQNLIEDIIGTKLYSSFFLGNDSFFSGHTGLPFLMALLYWDKKWLRLVFLAFSVMFGVVVLLGHLHYTIDVLSAFFITYGVYCMAKVFFKRDLETEK